MSTRLELEDLPPRYRAQAEKQIADRRARKAPEGAVSLEVAAKTAGEIGKVFESKGEYDFYIGTVLPGIQSGRIIKGNAARCLSFAARKGFLRCPSPGGKVYGGLCAGIRRRHGGGGGNQVEIHPEGAEGLHLPPQVVC